MEKKKNKFLSNTGFMIFAALALLIILASICAPLICHGVDPAEGELAPALATAIREGWALAVSPQAPGSRLNKKIATWCNEFLLKNADEIWAGDISPNGMLAQMLAGLGKSL